MTLSNTFENDILNLIFNATSIANLADNTATSPLTNLFVALHTADPGEAGTQATSEANYTGYARVAVPRTTGGWPASTAGQISPAAAITFPSCTGGTSTITFFSVGVASSGATKILWSGTVSPTINVSVGVTPSLSTSTYCSLD